eukprot:gnl/TRDRNA2_/TRDRNA2_37922_c0_seq1.p1 gnl/TRDRNA2_/TRDRNA2_37922_c0~~gnl/TRDRNA2_/TRDRNA2_37922_c0_seq1.p1  ORF type:complete len:462 (-),score=70.55 gnl/TRDRNA2_/TRDRNA2_37922_c0_seq1:201-1586(-)
MAVKTYTRSGGAKSGTESYFIGAALVLALGPLLGTFGLLKVMICLLALELIIMAPLDRNIMWYSITSQKLGPSIMRNASIGFAEAVRPCGKPTDDHCLNLYHYSGWMTSVMFGIPVLLILTFCPVIAFVRLFYPEHNHGVPKSRWGLYCFLVRHPVALQGEGPSNGDGLAAMNACESLIYPITPKGLQSGPKDFAYWLPEHEGKPRLRDLFHDKLFNHRFFESHGAKHATLVADVIGHKRRQVFLEPDKAPEKLVWKPRYSTMGLGVEKFEGWENVDDGKTWAPSPVPYVLEEFIQSTEYEASEWYRMTTLWSHDEAEPKSGYIWRTRNQKGDPRIQTDIIGGAYCITNKYKPFVGSSDPGMCVDPRTGKKEPLHPKVEKALTRAIDLMIPMHKNLGHELHSIGWDVMIVEDQPIFLEFNVNNGFFLCDHTLEEAEQMVAFYSREFFARLPRQLINFDPYA